MCQVLREQWIVCNRLTQYGTRAESLLHMLGCTDEQEQ